MSSWDGDREEVVCEGMGLEEFWDELKGGSGAAGQRVSREMGLVWCCTGQVSWSAHGKSCDGEGWHKPQHRKGRKRERVSIGMRGARPYLCRL